MIKLVAAKVQFSQRVKPSHMGCQHLNPRISQVDTGQVEGLNLIATNEVMQYPLVFELFYSGVLQSTDR